MKQPLSLILACIFLPSCAPALETTTDTPGNAQADVAAIEEFEKEFTAAVIRKDVEVMVNMMTDDAVAMPPGVTRVIGRDACRSFWEEALGDATFETHAAPIQEIVVDRDWAFVRATTETVVPVEDGEPVKATGKYIHILQRQSDGSWKLARDIWNSDGG